MFNTDTIYKNISKRKFTFVATFFIVVLITYALLYAVDFYPEPVTSEETSEEGSEMIETQEVEVVPVLRVDNEDEGQVLPAERISEREFSVESTPARTDDMLLPNRIVIPKSSTDVVILNPGSVDMNDLDNALLTGVIRHPQSADLDDRGNMLILGHSSYLPNVFNKNFQAFNGIQDLTWGDQIFVYGEEEEQRTYRVDRVYLVKASETVIDNSWGKSKLTLVTCNSFASKDDRYIVEATLISSAS